MRLSFENEWSLWGDERVVVFGGSLGFGKDWAWGTGLHGSLTLFGFTLGFSIGPKAPDTGSF